MRVSSHSAPHFCRHCRECEVGIHVIATNLGISCYSHDRYLCSRCSGYVGRPFFIRILQRISFSPSSLARVRRARDPHCFVILHSCKYFTLLCHYVFCRLMHLSILREMKRGLIEVLWFSAETGEFTGLYVSYCRDKVDHPHLVAFQFRTPIFEW